MTARARWSTGLVCAFALVTACSAEGDAETASTTSTHSEVDATQSHPDGCTEDIVSTTVCEFVQAVRSGDLSSMTPTERQVAGGVTDLPDAPWRLAECELVGDVTVACRVVFSASVSSEPEPVASFDLQPSNGEYNAETGGIDTPSGEAVDYEVISYGGLQPSQDSDS